MDKNSVYCFYNIIHIKHANQFYYKWCILLTNKNSCVDGEEVLIETMPTGGKYGIYNSFN